MPGEAPAGDLRTRYGDSTHTVQPDRWVVFHLHIPIGVGTFLHGQQQLYPAVAAITMYHSQEATRPSAVTYHPLDENWAPDYRAEFRLATNVIGYNVNDGDMTNYNTRTEPIRCPDNHRWYLGIDRNLDIDQLRSDNPGIPIDLARQLNSFVSGSFPHSQIFNIDSPLPLPNLSRFMPAKFKFIYLLICRAG